MNAERISAEELIAHVTGLRRLAARLVANDADADDLVQQTIAAGIEHPPKTSQPIAAWLAHVMRNFATQRWRGDTNRVRYERTVARAEAEPSESELIERLELHRIVAEEVLGLPAPYRQAILSLYFESVSSNEHAVVSGIAPATVRTHLHRGIELLRARLDARSNGDRTVWLPTALAISKGHLPHVVASSASAGWTGGVLVTKSLIAASILLVAIPIVLLLRDRDLQPPAAFAASAGSSADPGREVAAVVDPQQPIVPTPVAIETNRASVDGGPNPSIAPPQTNVHLAGTETVLRVRVVAKESAAPIEGLRLALVPGPPLPTDWAAYAVAGSHAAEREIPMTALDGRVEFIVAPNQTYHLYSWAKKWSSINEVVAPLMAHETRDLTISVQSRGDRRFYGRVVADDGGTPIAGAQLLEISNHDERSAENEYTGTNEPTGLAARDSKTVKRLGADEPLATSDANGVFEFAFETSASIHAAVRAVGFATALFAASDGHDSADQAREIRLEPEAVLVARVVDGSRAVRGANVMIETNCEILLKEPEALGADLSWFSDGELRWAAETDSNGAAILRRLPSRAELVLQVAAPDKAPIQVPAKLTFRPGEKRELTIDLASSSSIRGRVVDQFGHPLASCGVWAMPATVNWIGRYFQNYDRPTHKTVTDEDGSFQLPDVRSGAWYVGPAAMNPASLTEVPMELRIAPFGQVVEVVDGAPSINVEVRAWRGLSIQGRVEDDAGQPVERATVTTVRWKTLVEGGPSCRSDADGAFVLGPLPDFEFEFIASGSRDKNAPSELVAAHAGTRDVVLRLRSAAAISGRTIDAKSREAAICHTELAAIDAAGTGYWRTSGGGSQETFDFKGFVGGRYALIAHATDGRIGVFGPIETIAGRTVENVEVLVDEPAHVTLHYVGREKARACAYGVGEIVLNISGLNDDAPIEFDAPAGEVWARIIGADQQTIEERKFQVSRGQKLDLVFGEKH